MAKVEKIDGANLWTKTCPHCKKEFKTFSRKQKFCCAEHGMKYNKRIKTSRKKYDEVKGVERLRTRAHAFAVSLVTEMERLGIRERKCVICGAVENLELHHKNLNWADNTPSNLEWLCKKHHAEEHSKLQHELDSKGILVEEYYEESMKELMYISMRR